ncbi:Zn(2)-C6 fungal-type domain-containing protein [Favolaschia claudopus]|uniref:Zn(2)-C6 fungal-type domain-containing protein n=1 Tax=Favolaschia claudopus TaxID=2862362 RepID=A0AAW0DAI3_9AGAR
MSSRARTTNTRAPRACLICRARKSRCDGAKPVCGSCVASGRDDECSWGKTATTTKFRTEAHFEALRKRAESLQVYVEVLEGLLSKCTCQDVSSHLHSQPQRLEDQSTDEGGESNDTDSLDSEEEITRELTVPASRLKLGDHNDDPLLHGAFFRVESPSHTSKTELTQPPTASYVLQLDGVNQPQPDVDWSRHLPPETIWDRKQHDKVLDLAFKSQCTFPIVPFHFLRDMYRALSVPVTMDPPKTPHYSPMLHNAILASALVFSDDPYLRDPKTRLNFIRVAQARFDLKKPDASMVHALAFIAMFYTDIGDRIPAELYLGMSIRLSLTLGLDVDATEWVKAGAISHDDMVQRVQTHWTIFEWDVVWAVHWGRDVGGPPRRSTPLPFVDDALDQMPWFHSPAKIPPQPNYMTLIFSKTAALSVIACKIPQTIYLLRSSSRLTSVQIAETITKIDLELNDWKSRLPPELDITLANRAGSTIQRLRLHLSYWSCSIVLHRPFLYRRALPSPQSETEVDHLKLCTRAAENILELVETWSTVYTLRLSEWRMGAVIFTAATVFLLRALHATTGSTRVAHGVLHTALTQVQTCRKYLYEMSESWVSAARTGDLLQIILDDKLKPVITRRLGATKAGEVFAAIGAAPCESNSSPEPTPSWNSFHTGAAPSSYASVDPSSYQWVPQLGAMSGWPDPMDPDFIFGQMQATLGNFEASAHSTLSEHGAAAFDINEFLFSNLDSFGGG